MLISHLAATTVVSTFAYLVQHDAFKNNERLEMDLTSNMTVGVFSIYNTSQLRHCCTKRAYERCRGKVSS
jgi:hypothetical protein